jgi:hypothetical protein
VVLWGAWGSVRARLLVNLARTELAAEFCAAVAADELRVIEATPHDYRRRAELLTTYASLR